MEFRLTAEQGAALTAWAVEQDRATAEAQDGGEPNYGAIGGALTYLFTPTSLGVVVRVRHAVSKAEIDLTDYENW